MRKLASVQKILSIMPIEGADKIELAKVGGWQSVVEKNKYKVDDYVVYVEIDSWVPTNIAPHLSKGQDPREYNGIKGEKLKTVRLRGALSQGLILPYSILMSTFEGECSSTDWTLGEDVSDLLGIIKWEAPESARIGGVCKRSFPSFVPKTDQNRAQNLISEIRQYNVDRLEFAIEEKLEGSSCTISVCCDEVDVCSRNLSLREDPNNAFWKAALKNNLIEKISSLNKNIAFQFELVGESVEGNIYSLKGQDLFLYDIFDIEQARYLYPNERKKIAQELNIKCVPELGTIQFDVSHETTVDDLIAMANGYSQLKSTQLREGLVFKCINKNISFKAVSNEYLLKHS